MTATILIMIIMLLLLLLLQFLLLLLGDPLQLSINLIHIVNIISIAINTIINHIIIIIIIYDINIHTSITIITMLHYRYSY